MPSTVKIRRLADYFKIGMTDLTDEKENSEVDVEYADLSMEIGLSDQRFKRIIIEYSKLPVDKKNLLCEFFEQFIF